MDEHHIGYIIKIITEKLKKHGDEDLKKHGITVTQSRVLIYLNEHGGSSAQKDLGDYLEISHPTVVGIVSRMERNGFVTTHVDAADRRNKIVSLTAHAREIAAEMKNTISANDRALIAGLTEKQVRDLIDTLTIIYNNTDRLQ